MNRDLFHKAISLFRRKSLATRLTWVSILMVTLALIALGSGLIFIAHTTQRDCAFRLQQQTAERVSQLISDYMARTVDRLVFFLESTPLASQSPEQQRTAVENLLITSLPLYSQISILDEEGNEVNKISRFHTFLPGELINQAQSPPFLTSIRGDRYMGPVAFFEDAGLLFVSIALPIKTQTGRITGVIIAEVNVSHLWQRVARIRVGQSGYAYLVDMKGRFVAYQKPAQVLQRYGEDMKRMPPVSEFVVRGQGETGQVQEYQGLVNEEVIGVYAPIKGTAWAVLVEQPTREAYAGIREMQKYLFGLMALCIILAGGGGFYVSRRLIGPIRNLTEAAQRFGTGDLETEFIYVQREDEVGVLSHAFKKMQKELRDLYAGLKGKIEELEIMQNALRESEEKYRTILESIEDGYYEVDIYGNFTFFNDSLCEIYGYSRDELMGTNIRMPTDQETTKRGYEVFNNVYTTGRPEKGFEWAVLRKDGAKGVVEASVSLRRDAEGKPIGFRGIVRDISEKRRLEAQLQQAQKMEAVATLTGGIAHDYNNLLSIIVGNLGLAMQEAEPGSDLTAFLAEAEKASRKVGNLTHELMALSRGGAMVKEVGPLKEILRSAASTVPPDPGVSFNESISDDLWPVPHDSRKMEAVFRNVLTNAVEAMPDGGTLNISAENLRVEDDQTDRGLPPKAGDYVKITIEDQGRGIPEDVLDKLFDPYFSTKPMGVQKGMGLGLATAYAIVKRHDGHISINSTPGVGTTVSIYLPAAEREVPKEERKKVESMTVPGVRVLVMDDEEMLRNLVQQMLTRLGYEIKTVKDGVEAIEAYGNGLDSHEPFDAVILDLTVKGGMGGEQTIQELVKIDPDIKAIASSGYSNDPVMADPEKYGFKTALAKPYEMKRLKETLKKVL
ncbi:MAG: PAS domain S-box protein [Deltaproteobacteria bacterium]|nr:PAS domain S-box protein [Deltaproteobacteria bacterium]